jgi:WD40 repeat protein
MPWKLPRPRFGLRTLLVVVLASGIGLAFWTNPGRWRTYRNQQARQRIDPYELAVAGDGNRHNVPPELVAILGDSRLNHWHSIRLAKQLGGDLVATCSGDGTVRIWNANNGRQVTVFVAVGLAATESGDRLFLAKPDGAITCWDVISSKTVRTFGGGGWEGNLDLAANVDGSVVVVEKRRTDDSREITVWDANRGVPLIQFEPRTQYRGALCVTRDGKLFTWAEHSAVQVCETATGKVLRTIGPITEGGSRHSLGKVALTADETRLFVGSSNHRVVVFDWATGEEIERIGGEDRVGSTYNFDLGLYERGIVLGIPPAIFTRQPTEWKPYGTRLAEGAGGILDWKDDRITATRGTELFFLRSFPPLSTWRVRGVRSVSARCLAFDPNGRELLVGDSLGRVTAYSVGTWQPGRSWLAHEGEIESLAIAANGSKIATTSTDGIAIWDRQTLNETVTVRQFIFSGLVGLSPDGKRATTGLYALKGDVLEVWDVESGKSLAKLGPLPSSARTAPAWSPDGKRLVCVDMNSTLYAFDMDAGKLIGALGKSSLGQQKIHAVWFSDSKRLVTAGWRRDEVHLLEIGKTTPVATINTGGGQVRRVALHPSEKWIATCGDNTPVQIWHLPTAKLVKSWQIGPDKGMVYQAEFSPDGNYLATVNGNGTVYVLNLDGVLSE